MRNPSLLLSCLLFSNMTVNILFYSVSSVLLIRIENNFGVEAAIAAAIVTFGMVLLLGEILPKSISFANSSSISEYAALPAYLLVKVLGPVLLVHRTLILDPTLRLLFGKAEKTDPISSHDFMMVIQQVRKRGLISDQQTRLLNKIVELGFLKVRHVMSHRVDMVVCNVTDSNESMKQMMLSNSLTKVCVYAGDIDNIVGMVSLRQLILAPETNPDRLVQRVHFVPEQKTVESLLEYFRMAQSDTAMVVDEYGGIEGSVCLENVVEELIGPLDDTGQRQTVEQIGPLEYRLSGDLMVHEWRDVFGVKAGETRFSTIGGLVTAMIGRIAKPEDKVRIRNLNMTVEKVSKHRIQSLILKLEPTDDADREK